MTPLVFGFGQRVAGDDAVGLWVARQLVELGIPARESGDASVLLPLLAQGQPVIVVDAVVCAAPSGTVLHLTPDALARGGVSPVSCHGLGIAQVLALARELYGDEAAHVDIVGIAITRPGGVASDRLSAAARAAVNEACTLVRRLLDRAASPNPDSNRSA